MQATNIQEHPEFQYAPSEDVELVDRAASLSDWPSDAAARVAKSLIRYTREVMIDRKEALSAEQMRISMATFEVNLEILEVLEARGKEPADQQWGRYLDQITKGCNQTLIDLDR